MLEIKITGETPLEALASLTAFGLHCLADKAVHDAANRILEAEQAKEPYVEEPPHGEPAPQPEQPPAPADQPKPPTLEEVRAKGLNAARKHGQPAVKAILEGFGVTSMSNLAESDRAAFLVKLEALEGPGDGNA